MKMSIFQKIINPDRVLIICFLFLGPFLYLINLYNLRYLTITLIFCIMIYAILGRRISSRFFILALFFLTISAITFFATGDIGACVLVSTVVSSYFFIEFLKIQKLKIYFNNIIELFIRTSFVLCVIGLVYAILGGTPIIEFSNFDQRTNYLFLTTLSNSWYPNLNIFRPSFIFDEPGTFAHFSLLMLTLRAEINKGNNCKINLLSKKEIWLLALPLITISLAYVVSFLFIILLAIIENIKNFKRLLIGILFVAFSFIFFVYAVQAIDSEVFDRLIISRIMNDGNFILFDQDRIKSFMNGINLLNVDSFFWGQNAFCMSSNPSQCNLSSLDADFSIISPILTFGIFKVWPFYVIFIYLFIYAIAKKRILLMGLILFTLQRPDLLSLILINLTACLIYLSLNSTKEGVKSS